MTRKLAEGDAAPTFELPTDGAAAASLASYRGRKLVLFFYPRDDTKACTEEAVAFNERRAAFRAAGTDILGVSADSVRSHGKFRKKHALILPLASDEAANTLRAYGVWVEKSMWGRKFMGVERSTFLIGGEGEILRIWRKVGVPGHVEEVLRAAQSA